MIPFSVTMLELAANAVCSLDPTDESSDGLAGNKQRAWDVVFLSLYSPRVCLKQNGDEASVIPHLTLPTHTAVNMVRLFCW